MTRAGEVAKTKAPVPVSSEIEESKLAEVIESAKVPYKVPEVGRVTEVLAVVKSERALVAEKVITSPPARVMEFVAKVVESETAKVFPAEMFKVLVPLLVIAKPLNKGEVTAVAKVPVGTTMLMLK